MVSPATLTVDSPMRRHAVAEVLDRAGLPTGWASHGQSGLRYGAAREGVPVQLPDKGLFERRDRWAAEARAVLALVDKAATPEDLAGELFAPTEGRWLASHDLPAVVHGLLHRWEEDLDSTRDEHGRWPLSASLLRQGRLVERPAADWIARAVGCAVCEALGVRDPAPLRWNGREWAVALTFDIDSAGMYVHGAWPRTFRRLQVQRGVGAMLPFAAEAPLVLAGRHPDPHANLDALADRLEELGVRSTFFVQALRASGHDSYALERAPGLVRELRRLRGRGHEIGLHGSYATPEKGPGFLARQRRVVMRHTGTTPSSHRAHYLRTSGPGDAALWSQAGLRLDATPGFAEREGFRLGTAFPVTLPPEETGTEQPLVSVPVHAMDVTLRFHRQLTPAEARRAVLGVLRETRRVGGLAVLLWHPHNLEPRQWAGWEELPFDLMRWAVENGAATGTLEELAATAVRHDVDVSPS